MKFTGRVWKFGDDVDTDAIIPARYLVSSEPSELARHVMEDADPAFPHKVRPGDIIVAGKNFGCGSSREHAPLAIKAAGVQTVIAKSFARIFYRNAFNIGFAVFECPELYEATQEGDILEVDAQQGLVSNLTRGGQFPIRPIPPFMKELIEAGGLIEWTRKKLQEASS